MALYRFQRLDAQGQACGPGVELKFESNTPARVHGWDILAAERLLPAVEIWAGKRRVAHLTQTVKLVR